MVSIEEALELINQHVEIADREWVELSDALGQVIAEDILSPISLPPFDQSAMDGYAIRHGALNYHVVGEMKAGDTEVYQINEKEAMRIFTGAMVPEGTTAIAMQEIVTVEGKEITLLQEVANGTSIRRAGEELEKGELALKKGTVVNAAAIGFLSGLGITKIPVFRKPKIAVLTTGNELLQPGQELVPGKIFESNSILLKSALTALGYQCTTELVRDNLNETIQQIESLIEKYDILLTTGGISVGDYDFVGKALNQLEVDEIFYKVKQKPGKPLFFGKKKEKVVFALPGNPAAVLTSFYMYVLPAIRKVMGREAIYLDRRNVAIAEDFTKKGNRGFLLKGKLTGNLVEVHKGQSSAMLSSFVSANCLIHLREDQFEIKKGDTVEVFMLPLQS